MKKSLKIVILLSVIVLLVTPICCFGYNLPFADVGHNEWYAESVEYVDKNGLMNGTADGVFDPQSNVTRAMIVTILYRYEGSPTVKDEIVFTDVRNDAYYCNPVIWANENGIVNGYTAETFRPNDEITREQFAAIVYRYVNHKGFDIARKNVDSLLTSYDDESSVSKYAYTAMRWANGNGIINGVTDTELSPQGKTTRAQTATIFMRLDKLICSDNSKEKEVNTNGNMSQIQSDIPLIVVESGNIKRNDKTVDVKISLVNNPGVSSLKLLVDYPENCRLKSVKFADDFGAYVAAPEPYGDPQILNFISPFEDMKTDGDFATLTFTVDDIDGLKKEEMTVICDQENTFDTNFQKVHFEIVNN